MTESFDYVDIIKAYRQDNNLSTGEFAKLVGCSQAAISQYETRKRKPSVAVLEKISKVIDLPIDFMLSAKGNLHRVEKPDSTFEITKNIGLSTITAKITVAINEDSLDNNDDLFSMKMQHDLEKKYIEEVIREFVEKYQHHISVQVIERVTSEMKERVEVLKDQIKALEEAQEKE